MPLKNDTLFVIRKYGLRDRPAVRRICCETALMGEPSSIFFGDDEIFSDALTTYFTDYEPESCFVAEYDKAIVGYLLGAKSVKHMNKVFAGKIILPLLIKALRRGTFFHWKNIKFLSRVFLSLMKGEFNIPDFSKDYPATLHINVNKECRMSGAGSKLIGAYLDHLRAEGISGAHLATMSEKGGQFFKKLNFQLLFKGQRSYFRYFLGRNVPLYIYGMKIRVLP
jgi:hypothetical protein